MNINLSALKVCPIKKDDESRYRSLMAEHHYLGDLSKIGHTLWYVVAYEQTWVALLSFSASALKCGVRDQWIGWDFRNQYGRLKLIANNSRFLILPEWHYPNLASKILALCQKRIASDWQTYFAQPLLLLETFVDSTRFHGTIYRASNWTCLGKTRGFSRTSQGYTNKLTTQKLVFVYPLTPEARAHLSAPVLNPVYQTGPLKMKLAAEQMAMLPDFFANIPDPRRTQGRRHSLRSVLAISAGAVLCGMSGYKAIAGWAEDLGQKARARFGCRRVNGLYHVPSESIIRDILVRVSPDALDSGLQKWNAIYGSQDTALAVDGKTMCNAVDDEGNQTHIMSVIGHESTACYTQKK
jgi:hypothetical protein